MSLEFTHKPNYFLYAQLIIRHIEQHVKKHAVLDELTLELRDIYTLFQQDLASASINLDGIMNIADEYKVETLSGDQKIIQAYHIHATEQTLVLQLHQDAVTALTEGKKIIAPDASIQE